MSRQREITLRNEMGIVELTTCGVAQNALLGTVSHHIVSFSLLGCSSALARTKLGTNSCPHRSQDESLMSRISRRIGAISESATLAADRSEEHTSELQSRENLVCRLLLER